MRRMNKLSKYTFVCKNKSNDLLLYNTLRGVDSFCKIPEGGYVDDIKSDHVLECIDEKYHAWLEEKGILVNEKVDERKRLLYQISQTVNPRILTIHVNSTEHCNFRCKYCYESHTRGEMSVETQDNLIKFVRENIRNYAGLHVEWFGGEPLLGMGCVRRLSKEFKKICTFNRRKYVASMTTNGYLLTKELFEELLSYDIRQYQITVDGIEEDHDMFRVLCNGKGTFQRIADNLIDIKSLRRRDFAILLRSNITLKNFENIEEYLALLERFTFDDDRIKVGIFKVGNWLDKASDDIREDIIEDSGNMRRIYQAILDSDRSINLSNLFLNPGSGVCYAGKTNSFLVCSDGSLHKCTVTFEEKDSVVGEIVSGKMILNEKYYEMISDYSNCDKVFDCFHAPICMGQPCPVKSHTGSNCSFFKDSLDLILQIFDKNGKFETMEE